MNPVRRNHFVFVLMLTSALVCLPAAAQLEPNTQNPDVEEPEPNELPGGFTNLISANESADATLEFAAEAELINVYLRDYAPQPVPWCPNCCTDCCEPLPGGIDHVANGTGTRNKGQGTIRLRSAPDNAVAVRANLYWGTLEVAPAATQTINFEGHQVTGTLIGTTTQPCWNGTTTYALYQANVLPFIPPVINGDYQVDGFLSAITSGRDPWSNPNRAGADSGPPMSEGASLVVEYSHASIPAASQVYTHTGPWYFAGNTITLTHALAPPLPLGGYLRHTRIGGDGQVGGSVTPGFGASNDQTFINGVQIRGPGAPANQDSDWNGTDGGPLNQLWDTQTQDITGLIPVGSGSYRITYTSAGDCVVPSVHVLTSR